MLEVNTELNNIYDVLLNHDERIVNLEQQNKLLNWALTIDEYQDLDDATKIVRVVRDFSALMQGRQGTLQDLKLLRRVLNDLGLKQINRDDFIKQFAEENLLHTQLLGEGSQLGDFVTEDEKIFFDVQNKTEVESGRKFFPAEQVDANGFVLELLYNIKQLTLAKELSDNAENLFLTGYVDEARPLLDETTNEKNILKRRYMLSVIHHEGSAAEKNLDRARELLSENISESDVCSIFFGARIGVSPKEKASEHFYALTKLADAGDIFAQYELALYVEDSSNKLKYFKLAAEQKYFLAAFELGKMYCSNENYEQAREYLELAAQSEQHINSMIYLIEIYKNGFDGQVDKEKALHLCKKIYEREPSEDSINRIANFYDEVEYNLTEAAKWWTIGEEKNFPTCLYNLGEAYHYGFGVEKNLAAAVNLYERAYEGGKSSDDSIDTIANFYDDENNPTEAVNWWHIGAQKNFPTCLFNLGEAYRNGRGVKKNLAAAVNLYERAYEGGKSSDDSINTIANFYDDANNPTAAVNWWTIGAKKNFPKCLFNLGWAYRNGRGVKKNLAAAVNLYEKAYKGGKSSDDSIDTIANFYNDANNPTEAVTWWTIGAKKNFPKCLANLGMMYRYGRGVNKDWAKAVAYFKQAIEAEVNSGLPEDFLGEIYCLGGYGITRDYEKSVTYYEQALAKGRKLLDDDKKIWHLRRMRRLKSISIRAPTKITRRH